MFKQNTQSFILRFTLVATQGGALYMNVEFSRMTLYCFH